MPDHLLESRSEKPLYTLRFRQMRLAFLIGSALFLAYMYATNSQNIIFLGLLLVAVANVGADFTNILMQKRGMKSASPLIYESGNYTEYMRIIKAVLACGAVWLLFLVITFILAEDYQPLWLRINAVLVFNIVSITVLRWGREVYGMLSNYTKVENNMRRRSYPTNRIPLIVTPHKPSTSLPASMRPFTPNNSGQTASQPVQLQSVSTGNREGAKPCLPVASLPATMRPFTPNDSGQAVPQQSVSIAIRKGAQP